MRSEREKGGGHALGDSKGRSPWRAFGDFPRDGKVTRGGGAERPHKGRSAEDGAQPRPLHKNFFLDFPCKIL